jgi:4-diphosphocytidyl-2-C-methyl-D-erythritol kinase
MGLGGGSSDAAATLLALNELWGLGLPLSELIPLASKLGSDVPFFIHKGTALVEGKGEKVTPLPSLPKTHFVLVVPPLPKISGKTKQMYNRLDATYYTEGQFVQEALSSLRQGKAIAAGLMFNVFEKVAFDFFTGLDKYRKTLEEAGAPGVYLAGSGPCLFSLSRDEGKAREIFLQLQKQGLECYLASSSIHASVLAGL